MDKKVYNKPSLKLEIFTPNEYIASCWYIAEGDCLNTIIYKDNNNYFKMKDIANMDKWDLSAHGRHRVPKSGYFRDEGPNAVSKPSPTAGNQYWYYGGDFNNIPGNSDQYWTNHNFKTLENYYSLEVDGVYHYFTKISDAPNKNATS